MCGACWPNTLQVEQTEHGDLLRGLPVRLLIEAAAGKGGVMAQVQLGDQAQFSERCSAGQLDGAGG